MASRAFFIPSHLPPFYEEKTVMFEFFSGFALSQQQKSIRSMHRSIKEAWGLNKVLEISTRSESALGVSLSAFNLMLDYEGRMSSVESLYKASKQFSYGGPFPDIAWKSSIDAKKDGRLKVSGPLIHFQYQGTVWPLVGSPNFYDFLYISALCQSKYVSELSEYEAFSDIAYSTQVGRLKEGKSWNCQARSVAIFKSLSSLHIQSKVIDILKGLAQDSSRQIGNDSPTLF